MLTEPGGPFIDISKLNLAKYAQRPSLAKVCGGGREEDREEGRGKVGREGGWKGGKGRG